MRNLTVLKYLTVLHLITPSSTSSIKMGGNSLKNTSDDFAEETLLQLNTLESSKTSTKTNIDVQRKARHRNHGSDDLQPLPPMEANPSLVTLAGVGQGTTMAA